MTDKSSGYKGNSTPEVLESPKQENEDIMRRKEESIHDTQEPPEGRGDRFDERNILSPEKLKDIFDKMTEIDTNPRAKASKEFHQQVEEMERKNTHKR